MKTKSILEALAGFALLGFLWVGEATAQRGREGGGGGRSAGHRSNGAAKQSNRSPSMSAPRGGGGNVERPAQQPGGAGGGTQRPGGSPGGGQRAAGGPAGGVQRPSTAPGGGVQRPAGGTGASQRPAGGAGASQRPGGEAGIQRPGGGPGGSQRPGGRPAGNRPGGSSDQLSDFLGMQGPGSRGPAAGRPGTLPSERPSVGERPNIGDNRRDIGDRNTGNRTNIGDNRRDIGDGNIGNRTNIGDNRREIGDRNVANRTNIGASNIGSANATNINVGQVNVGNQVNYADNRQAWVSQRQNWGNDVRGSVGNRYNNVFNENWYRRPNAGGYNYWGGWAGRGANYAWTPAASAGVGTWLGGAWASAQPTYYGYGAGGNVYYENNAVYVNGQAAGSPEQYYQQTQAIAAAAPPVDQANPQDEWLPLGVYAVTSEDTPDASAVLQLAVNKQGALAGTYYNEDTQVSRPVQGMVDAKSQRAVMKFADGKDADLVLETGVYNLTQEEAPALLHFGAAQSQPMLLVRLKPPAQ
ncbi:MAG: hypothetical protein ACLQIB_29175 [Isosphaeraceae bacterium]